MDPTLAARLGALRDGLRKALEGLGAVDADDAPGTFERLRAANGGGAVATTGNGLVARRRFQQKVTDVLCGLRESAWKPQR